MDKYGNAYNLDHSFEEFKNKAGKKGFEFFISLYGIEIIKRPREEHLIVGNIFNERFLIIYSFPLDIERKIVKRKQAIKELEKIAKEFIPSQNP